MNIRVKLLVPLLLVAGCVLAIMHFIAFASLKQTLVVERVNGETRALTLVGLAIVPDLLASDLAKIYETLSEVEQEHPWWRSLTLTTPEGKQLYPLGKLVQTEAMTHLSVPVVGAGRSLGMLTVDLEENSLVAPAIAVLKQLELIVALILLFGTLAVVWQQNNSVIRPIKKLAKASHLLSEGDYDVTLPMASSDEIGKLVSAFKIMRDAVGSRESALRQSERWLEAVIDNSAEAILTLDDQGRIQSFNSAAERIFGAPASRAIGSNFDQLAPFVALGEVGSAEIEVARFDASQFPALITASRVSVGGQSMVVATIGDLTQRRQYERIRADQHAELERLVTERTVALKEAQREALQASRLASVGQLAAGIAHEINTPIQYIGDNLSFIQDATKNILPLLDEARKLACNSEHFSNGDPLIREYFDRVDQANLDFLINELPPAISQSLEGVAQVARIVLSMKEFSHPGTTQKSVVDLNRALENTVTVSRNTWKHIANMEARLDPKLPRVNCHPGEMNQVFLNLIINAAHAIDESGKPRPGKIIVETFNLGDFVEVRFSDNGTGVPDAIKDRIFDPFFTTKDLGKGTGQGLAICYDVVVVKHGGQILVGDSNGEGAVFTIRLPVA
jgi:signal transduction histidine kinase/HAMP domain-containing protein